MPNDTQQIEIITGRERHTRFTAHEKGALRQRDDVTWLDRLSGGADPRPLTEPSIWVEASHGRGRTGGGAG